VTTAIAAAHALIVVLPVSHFIPSLLLRGIAASLRYDRFAGFRRQAHDDSARPLAAPFMPGASVAQGYVSMIANLETNSAFCADILPLPFAMRTDRKRKSVKRWTRKSSPAAIRACRLSRCSRPMRLPPCGWSRTPDRILGGH